MLSSRISRLAAPPRPVPLSVACSAMLGGPTGTVGAIPLIGGLVFMLIFSRGFRLTDEIRLALSKATTQGTVTVASWTNATENQSPIYRYEFTFSTPREQNVTSTCYTTGQMWSVGDRVTIEYVPEKPSVARIQGARRSIFPPLALEIVLIFPVVGMGMLGASILQGWRQITLLREGQVADARLLSVQPTNVRVNNQPVLEYVYEIQTADGETFTGVSKALPRECVGDEEREPALYLPSNPYRSTLVDAIPLRYTLDVDETTGQWIARERPWRVFVFALVCASSLVLIGINLLRLL